MTEYIKREDVLRSLFMGEHNLYSWDEIEEKLMVIPAADVVERKKGKWIFDNPITADFACSECLERQDACSQYCPCCGAEMEVGK